MTELPNLEPFSIETVMPDLTCGWSADRSVVVLTLSHYSREVIDAWLAQVVTLSINWTGSRARRLVYHFTIPFSPQSAAYIGRRGSVFSTTSWDTHTTIHIAMIFTDAFMVSIARAFVAEFQASAPHNLNLNMELFSERDKAFAWLAAQVP